MGSSRRVHHAVGSALACCVAGLAAVASPGGGQAAAASSQAAAQTVALPVALPGSPSVWPVPSRFGRLTVLQLSGTHSLVAGAQALVGIGLPAGVPRASVRVTVNGRDETPAFAGSSAHLDPGFSGLVGLVSGLRDRDGGARNAVRAWAELPGGRGQADQLDLFGYPATGPVFSGPQLHPWFCTTQDLGLGPAPDADCDAPAKIQYWYMPANGSSLVQLTSLAKMPPDVAQIKTSQGRVVPYIVRLETGTLDRGVYYVGILDNPFKPGGNPQDSGWNRKLVYAYAGGCAPGNNQGSIRPGGGNGGSSFTPLDPTLQQVALARGYAVATSTLNWYATACNEVLSAEATLMVEQHFAQAYGVPDWTAGWGGSGGSIQQLQIAENYPGLLNGIIPEQTFPDAPTFVDSFADCGLLYRYFTSSPAVSWTPAQENAVSGYLTFQSCASLWKVEGTIFTPSVCAAPVPPQDVYDPATNPSGVRCDIFDQVVNLYGRNPATGYADRFFADTGVQYGLDALLKGQITGAQFLNLNAHAGGIGVNGDFTSSRTGPDPAAVRAAYGDGRMDQGQGGLPDLPILDIREWADNSSAGKGFYDPHVTIWSMITRARLDAGAPGGMAGNYVNWVYAPATSLETAVEARALATMDQWLDNIAADPTGRPLPAKITAGKPGTASDACFTADGTRHQGPVTVGGTNFCSTTFPAYSIPRLVAGSPLSDDALDCQLRPVDPADYQGKLTAGQLAELRVIFPDGVCDYSSQGQYATPFQGTWLAFQTAVTYWPSSRPASCVRNDLPNWRPPYRRMPSRSRWTMKALTRGDGDTHRPQLD
jgi:hypothetical protein